MNLKIEQKHLIKIKKYAQNLEECFDKVHKQKYNLISGSEIIKTFRNIEFKITVASENDFIFRGKHYKTYIDGGISGGTMERPALKQMLDDISKGLVQTVLVYKVDRLSRSIMDFHNMMKDLEKYNCNFVSITQSFDTSNSMGKLTLNMLLSFAQFEREVSSERVRDKLCAQKAKGLWTGGVPKLGYDLKDKKLIINPEEAKIVNQIFQTYLEAVQEKLKDNNNRNTDICRPSNNLLSGKVFNANGTIFTNQQTSGKGKTEKRYYAMRGFYIPANDIDKLSTETVKEILNSDLSKLDSKISMVLKQINWEYLDYFQQRKLIQTMIEKIIYNNNKITFFINHNVNLNEFSHPEFMNENNNPLEYIVNDNQIIIEKDIVFNKGLSSNKYNAGKTGLMTIYENQQSIV